MITALRPWWSQPRWRNRWAQEPVDMSKHYPGFEVIDRVPNIYLDPREREHCGDLVRTWRGYMTPFSADLAQAELAKVVADLDANLPIGVAINGGLRHLADCPGAHHLRPELNNLGPLQHTYQVEIAYRIPPAHPVVRCRKPQITKELCADHPHLMAPIKALCVSFPPEDDWNWEVDGARRYADYAAIFLGKHSIWIVARGRVGSHRGWPGADASHFPADLARTDAEAPCHCGSSKPYGGCCSWRDRENIERERRGLSLIPAP